MMGCQEYSRLSFFPWAVDLVENMDDEDLATGLALGGTRSADEKL